MEGKGREGGGPSGDCLSACLRGGLLLKEEWIPRA